MVVRVRRNQKLLSTFWLRGGDSTIQRGLGWGGERERGPRGAGNVISFNPLVVQMVKNLSEMQETQVQSLSQEDPSPGEGNGYPLQSSCLENPMEKAGGYSPWGHKESDMTKWLKRPSSENRFSSSFSIFYIGYSSFVCPLKVSISDKSLISGSCKPVRYLFLSSKWNIILKDLSPAVSAYQCGKIDYGYVLLGQGEYKLGIRFSI